MDFNLSDEQQQIKDTLTRFVARDYGFEKRRAILKSPEGYSPEAWKQLADMGLLALGLPEEHGGLPGNAVDTMLVMEVLGRGIVVEPYLATVVLGARLIALAGSEAQKTAILPQVASGDLLLAFAHYEPDTRYETGHVSTQAKVVHEKRGAAGYTLNGAKSVVLHGAQAGKLIVSARTSGKDDDAKGISLFLVERTAKGVTVQDYPTHDGHRAAEITFKNAPAELLGKEGEALPVIERALGYGIAALCAEAVGNMVALIEITLNYIKTRKQFGVPIGSFQALQHRMADMLMYGEQARSMALLAAAKADSDDDAERSRVLSAAKALTGQAARFIGQQAVQLHGGIGVTDEVNVSHYFKRLTMINATFGDADHHLGRFSDQMLAQPAAEQRQRKTA
jgi:alkylation response protein AidB-like acyl-CoA dehydrogenase